jgi:hypothetical protein
LSVFKNLPKESDRPFGENSPNLVTLALPKETDRPFGENSPNLVTLALSQFGACAIEANPEKKVFVRDEKACATTKPLICCLTASIIRLKKKIKWEFFDFPLRKDFRFFGVVFKMFYTS